MKKILLIVTSFLVVNSLALADDTVSSSDIIHKLNSGLNIYYENVTIRGPLDFTKISNIAKQTTSRGSMRSAEDKVNRYVVYVEPAISFVNCVFEDEINAYVHRYDNDEKVTIISTVFDRHVNFKKCEFRENVNFYYTEIDGECSFDDCIFKKKAEFFEVNFKSNSSFRRTKFFQLTNFKGATFYSSAIFYKTEFFSNETYLDYIDFYGMTSFAEVKFSNETIDMNESYSISKELFKIME